MKKLLASFLLFVCAQHVFADTYYDQLCTFNPNWAKYKHQAPEGEARRFDSDKEYVKAHLGTVLPILRAEPVAHLTTGQRNSRIRLIDMLDAYRIAGNFPLNYYRRERIPVFIDEHGTHCAVGYLLQQTGHEDLALCIAAADNYAWVKDIHDEALLEWQQSSGLSLENLKLIQGAYDYYVPGALLAANKYEIPQKPACMITYFEDDATGNTRSDKEERIWCRGEGENGILNGRWEQNYAIGVPWIEGYFQNGKRAGQWKEYYQGTNKLCRTEHWRDDKLNGIRKRYDREGVLIEEILFMDGTAVTKTNYDHTAGLRWVRKPLDSNRVSTEVFTFDGALLAAGDERIHNPGNLQWFQNIELTALNSAAITSKEIALSVVPSFPGHRIGRSHGLYNATPLVDYRKEGVWVYYKEFETEDFDKAPTPDLATFDMLLQYYPHFAGLLCYDYLAHTGDVRIGPDNVSIQVRYTNTSDALGNISQSDEHLAQWQSALFQAIRKR